MINIVTIVTWVKNFFSILIVVQILIIDSLHNRHCKDVLLGHLSNKKPVG